MKKVFLSLATVAFVAVGSLTMTSCGDDESTPGPGPGPGPGEEHAGKLTVDGSEYGLDTTDTFVYSVKGDDGKNYVALYNYVIQPGDTITATRWAIQSYSGEDSQATEDLHLIDFYIEQDADAEGLTFPNQAETFYIQGLAVVAGGSEVEIDGGSVALDFNVFDTAGQIDYSSTLTGSKNIKAEFNGEMGLYNYIPTSGKGAKNVFVKNAATKFNANQKVNFALVK